MNNVVKLVNEWAAFERIYPDAGIEDFCRHYLVSQREQTESENLFGGFVPPEPNAYLMKLMGWIVGIFSLYAQIALRDLALPQLESFYFLNSLKYLGEARKTDLINANLFEFSTGIDILNRMTKADLISERTDPSDRRSRLVTITPKGEEILHQCYARLSKVGQIIFGEMPEEDKRLCIQLLRGVESRHSKYCLTAKNKTLDEIYDDMVTSRQTP